MSHFTTLHNDDGNNRDHDIDADLGGLDEEIRRHRAIATDVTLPPMERETAQTTARTIAHCVYLLRGKTLIGITIGVIIWLRRFRRTATIVAATAGFSSAAAIGGAAIITPSTPHYTAAPPAATAPVHHRPVTHHAAGTPTGRTTAGGNDIDAAGPAVAGAPSTVQHEPRTSSVNHTRATTKATTVGIPPPTVVHHQRPTTAPTPTSEPTQPDPTTTPTTEPTEPTQPTQPTAPTSSGPTSLLHLKLPLPVKLNVTGLLGLN